jgi:hypothetical protein
MALAIIEQMDDSLQGIDLGKFPLNNRLHRFWGMYFGGSAEDDSFDFYYRGSSVSTLETKPDCMRSGLNS